jgi:plasmid stabilization system protein ParE
VAAAFRLHPLAAREIRDIWKFIAKDSPRVAGQFREEILHSIQRLVTFTHQGHKRPDLTSRPLRFIAIREYLIAYAPHEKPLWVIAVMHGRRSPRVMAAILRGRE